MCRPKCLASSSSMRSHVAVPTMPGQWALTVMPYSAHSCPAALGETTHGAFGGRVVAQHGEAIVGHIHA
jgi:hypothetical protein